MGSAGLEALEASLREALERYGLREAEVRATRVETIETHATTGKLKRFIALPV